MRVPGTPRISTRRGMTLIEVMVALVMMGVALIGVAGGLFTITRVQRSAQLRSEMTFAADDVIERMRTAATHGTADVTLLTLGGSRTTANPVAPHVLEVTGASGRSFRLQWGVTSDPTLTRAVAMRISTYPSRSGDPAPLDFDFLLPPPP